MAKQRQSYLRKVSEVFGYSSEATSSEALRARRAYQCPFLNAKCVKPSQHGDYDVSIPFGACSVWHRGTGVTNRILMSSAPSGSSKIIKFSGTPIGSLRRKKGLRPSLFQRRVYRWEELTTFSLNMIHQGSKSSISIYSKSWLAARPERETFCVPYTTSLKGLKSRER